MAVRSNKPVPEGMNSVTTELWFNGNCREAIEFYKKAFNAKLVGEAYMGPEGKSVMHAMIRIGDSNIMLADAMPDGWEAGPVKGATAGIYLYVEDADTLFSQAVKTGCNVIYEMMDAFWGDRNGKVKDPYGHCWSIATLKWIMTPEEMARGQEEWLKSMASA